EHGAQRSAPTGDVDSARVGKTVNILNVEEREPSTLGGAFGKAVQLLARLGVAVGIGPLQDGDGKKAFEVLAEKARVQGGSCSAEHGIDQVGIGFLLGGERRLYVGKVNNSGAPARPQRNARQLIEPGELGIKRIVVRAHAIRIVLLDKGIDAPAGGS